MKVVVTSSGSSIESEVDPRFGRASQFVLVDTSTGEARAVENSAGAAAAQGAGIQAAQTVSRLGADCLVTGHCGPKAYRTLQAAGITVYIGASGTVADAVSLLLDGRLTEASGPDVEGHWT
jgi:predicted Fe-Mo cluster-binding NifX family protein